jgi:intracellular multiplication protein IcmL
MANDAVELVRLRNNFYRDNYRRVLLALLVLLLTVVLLVSVVFYQIYNRPTPQYFAVTTDGRIMQLFPLSQPMLSPGELLQWAHRAAISAYSYNFVNYREALQELQNNFTPAGWRHFENALRASRNLEMVITKKLVVSAVATGTPVILDQAVIDGRYSWRVQIPLLVSYQSPNEQTQRPVMVMMIISRVPTVDMPKGIAIVSFVASESTGSGG